MIDKARGFSWAAAGLTASWALPAAAETGAPTPWQLYFQPAVTPVMRQMVDFHNLLLVIAIAISVFVMGLMAYVMIRFRASANPVPSRTSHNTLVEVVWTTVPIIILLLIAVPSFRLLYYSDRAPHADFTIKVTGHQWYWSYAYPDNGGFGFDSNQIASEDIKPGQVRMLEVDNPLVLPVGKTVRILIVSEDVIHSWSVPSFGVKTDAMPGRVNETWAKVEQPGIYYGQCDQLCGINHGFMPIEVKAVSEQEFQAWVADQAKKNKTAGAEGGALHLASAAH